MKGNPVAGLDIGTTKTCAVIAVPGGEPGRRPQLEIVGVGQARSGGIRREVVAHIDEAAASIRSAMREAELMAGVTLGPLWVGIGGNHLRTQSSLGVVALGDGEIAREDVAEVHRVARAVALSSDRIFLHEIVQEYLVDGQGGISDPVGMSGVRLEADVFLTSCSASVATNIRKAVSKAGYRTHSLIPAPFAAARAVLSEDEKEVGVAMVGIGGSTTELVVYRDGRIRHVGILAIGGSAVTRDLVKGLAITFAEAERAKALHGVASVQLADPKETVAVAGPSPGQTREVSVELMAHIVEERLDELFGLVHGELEKEGLLGDLGAGVVLTGGSAALKGVVDLASGVFSCPVRVGPPTAGLGGLAESVQRSRFATATGLCLHWLDIVHQSRERASPPSLGRRIWRWIREFF